MKAIIVEDEPLVAKNLVRLLQELDHTISVERILASVEEAVPFFQSSPEADVVFMDIQLNDGISFDIFDRVKINIPVIFTTAYNEFAIRAFKVNSVDYLLKPIDREELYGAIEKVRSLKRSSQVIVSPEQLTELVRQLSVAKTPVYRRRFMARHAGTQLVLGEQEISHFRKDSIIFIVTNEQKEYVTDYQTMDEIEEVVDPGLFFRANRQTIIQINAVENFKTDHYGKLQIKLKRINTGTVDISREKAAAFRAWMG